ncbi:MAG: hypothetical protein ACXVD4_05285 [Nocardioides sp.]
MTMLAGGAPAHTHEWELRSVDFEDHVTVTVFECAGCDETLVRS